jgi:hypothetical protein
MINKNEIYLNEYVSQKQGNIVSDMNGEKVMLSIQNNKYYNLGHLGGVIWELINDPIEINELITNLLSHYDVGEIECRKQVMDFLLQLEGEGLIDINKGNSLER